MKLNLGRNEKDEDCTVVVSSISDEITEGTELDRIDRKFEVMEGFPNCRKYPGESMKHFITKFNMPDPLHLNQVEALNPQTTTEELSLSFKNCKLTDDSSVIPWQSTSSLKVYALVG